MLEGNNVTIPKNPDASNVAILRARASAIQVPNSLQFYRILRDVPFLFSDALRNV